VGLDELWAMDAVGQAAEIKAGRVGPGELAELAVERIARIDAEIGSVVTVMADRIVEADITAAVRAGAPFAGVPILLKDAGQELDGAPYGAGLRVLHEIGYRSKTTTPFATRLENLGFVIVGKAACSELMTGTTTEPPGLDPTRNPWDLARSSGGSSGGSAAAVAAGLVPIAHGSDHTGSLRYPASACGCATLKPSRGRIDSTAIGGIRSSLNANVDFVLTRSVRDLEVVLGEQPATRPGCRIGVVSADPIADLAVHATCVEAVQRAGLAAEALGHHVEQLELGELSALVETTDSFGVVTAWSRAKAAQWLSSILGRPLRDSDLSPELLEQARAGTGISDNEEAEAARQIMSALAPAARKLADYDFVVTPTLRQPAWPLGIEAGPATAGVFPPPFSIIGAPAMSIPFHHDAGFDLPIGVQIVGRIGGDAELLGFAAELERVEPWADRWPELALR